MDTLTDRLIEILKSDNNNISDEKIEEIRKSLNVIDQQYIEKTIKKNTNKVNKLKREIRKIEKENESLKKLRI